MELNYKQRANGMYILYKEDIEQIATDTLKEFSPQNLDYPSALDTDSFLVDHLGLLLKERYLGIPGKESVLGLTVMCDSADVVTLDNRCRPTVVEENYGTVVISTALNSVNNKGRKRYTKIHEGAHWLLHKDYYRKLEESSRPGSGVVACRNVESYIPKQRDEKDWIEWQADSLAASILMPRTVFYQYCRELLRHAGVPRGYLNEGNYGDKLIFKEIVPDLMTAFGVSSRAAQIRMVHLGLIRRAA